MTLFAHQRHPFAPAWAARCHRCGWTSPAAAGPEELPTRCPECGYARCWACKRQATTVARVRAEVRPACPNHAGIWRPT